MSKQNVDKLVERAKNNEKEALAELIKSNEGLIYSIINRFRTCYNEDDLYQVAVIGFIKAVKNYDKAHGAKLTTYAFPIILGEVRQYLRNERLVKYNRNIIAIAQKIEEATEILTQKYMRTPTINEITNYLGVSKSEILDALESKEYILSMDQAYDNETNTLHNTILDESAKREFEKLELTEELEKLDPTEKLLIKMRYNLEQTQVEVAKDSEFHK